MLKSLLIVAGLVLVSAFSYAAVDTVEPVVTDVSEVDVIGLPVSGESALIVAERLSASPGAADAFDNLDLMTVTVGVIAEPMPSGGAAAWGHVMKAAA